MLAAMLFHSRHLSPRGDHDQVRPRQPVIGLRITGAFQHSSSSVDSRPRDSARHASGPARELSGCSQTRKTPPNPDISRVAEFSG